MYSKPDVSCQNDNNGRFCDILMRTWHHETYQHERSLKATWSQRPTRSAINSSWPAASPENFQGLGYS